MTQLGLTDKNIKWLVMCSRILCSRILGAIFLLVAIAGLSNLPVFFNVFQNLNLSAWFQFLLSILMLAGATALIISRFAFYALVLLGLLMCILIILHSIYNPPIAVALPALLIVLNLVCSYFYKEGLEDDQGVGQGDRQGDRQGD